MTGGASFYEIVVGIAAVIVVTLTASFILGLIIIGIEGLWRRVRWSVEKLRNRQ